MGTPESFTMEAQHNKTASIITTELIKTFKICFVILMDACVKSENGRHLLVARIINLQNLPLKKALLVGDLPLFCLNLFRFYFSLPKWFPKPKGFYTGVIHNTVSG